MLPILTNQCLSCHGGAGIRTGLVVGKTGPDGAEVAERPNPAAELLSTICMAVGIERSLPALAALRGRSLLSRAQE